MVEDEPQVARALGDALRTEGHVVTPAGTGEDALLLASSRPFDLLILDRMPPRRDGLEIPDMLRRWPVRRSRAAEAHGGRVEFESEEGRGSTFRVVLPCGDAPTPAR